MSDHEPRLDANVAPTWAAVVAALAVLAPVIVAIWTLPNFVTQDGPAHVYNAHVLLDLMDRGEESPFARAYEARIQPVPNWAGHLALMGAMRIMPPRGADRLVMTATLVLPALALVGLCRRVAGRAPGVAVGLAAGVLSLNFLWLLGFYSFLLGLTAMLATWAHAWGGWSRGRMGLGWVVGLSAWVVIGYICHPISLGATVLGLLVLAPVLGREDRSRRLMRTAIGLAPLVPLGLVYRALMVGGGGLEPSWENLKGVSPIAALVNQVLWIEPTSVARRDRLPWLGLTSGWMTGLSPLVWLGLGIGLVVIARRPGRGSAARGWLLLGGLLLTVGVVSPDTLGPRHGFYLGQRLAMAGVLALLPAVAAGTGRGEKGEDWLLRLGTVALGFAGILQAATVVEYGVDADRKVGAYLAAGAGVGSDARVAGLVLNSTSPFRANALWHADTLLGIGTGNVVWSNYESAHYYFPVRVREGVAHPPIEAFEWISILDAPEEREKRITDWTTLLERHHEQIDGLVVWGSEEAVDLVTARWYEPVAGPGGWPARSWRRRTLKSEPDP